MEAKSMKSFSIHMAAYALAAAVLVTGCGKKSEDVAKQKPARPTQLDAPPRAWRGQAARGLHRRARRARELGREAAL